MTTYQIEQLEQLATILPADTHLGVYHPDYGVSFTAQDLLDFIREYKEMSAALSK